VTLSAGPRHAQALVLPPEPDLLGRLGRFTATVVALVAACWWASLARDAWLGRVSLAAPVLMGLLLIAWAIALKRWCFSPQRSRSDVVHPTFLWWSDQWHREEQDGWVTPRISARRSSPWRTPEGQQIDVLVRMDLGSHLLLCLSGGGLSRPVHRWVCEADLPGPWRWRLTLSRRSEGLSEDESQIMASSQQSTSLLSPLIQTVTKAFRGPQERA
jgi:hypothetical protein